MTGCECDKVSGVSWIPVKRRTIQSRRRVLPPENRPQYRVFRHNGVRYSETYLYFIIELLHKLYLYPKKILVDFEKEIIIFWGDLSGISAKKEALAVSHRRSSLAKTYVLHTTVHINKKNAIYTLFYILPLLFRTDIRVAACTRLVPGHRPAVWSGRSIMV